MRDAKAFKRRWLRRLLPAVLAVALTPAARAEHPLLASTPANSAWHAPEASNEADYIGDPAPETPLVLKKAPFTAGAVTLTIGSDADRCILRSGAPGGTGVTEIVIELDKDKISKLRLDGNDLHPRVILNDHELAPLRGKWIRLLAQPQAPTLTLVFINAKYVNVEYDAERLVPMPALAGGEERVLMPGTPVPTAASGIAVAAGSASAAPPTAQLPVTHVASPVRSSTIVGPDGKTVVTGAAVQGPPPGGPGTPGTPGVTVVASAGATAQAGAPAPVTPAVQPVAPNIQTAPPPPTTPSTLVPANVQPPTNSPGAPVARYATPSPTMIPPDSHEGDWKLSFRAGIDVTNAYFYRGIGQEDKGILLQPWLDADLRLYNKPEADIFNSMDVVVELWNTFDTGPTGYDNSADRPVGRDKYYEIRFQGGFDFRLFKRWLVDLDEQTRQSPNGRFYATHQMDFKITYDDHSPDYDWQLWPYALFSFEYEGQNDAGNANNNKPFQLGDYMEWGVRPELGLLKLDVNKDLTVAFPLAIGMSLHDYYQNASGHDNFFGFADIGTEFTIPLVRARGEPGRQFKLDFVAGVHMLILGDTARQISRFNGTSAETLEVIGSTGLVFTY